MLLPDLPRPASTGGQVRAFHFLEGLVEVADVTAAIFQGQEHGRMPACVADKCCTVLQPSAALPIQVNSAGNPVGRILSILISPWRNHGHSLMTNGLSLCVNRAESSAIGFLHQVYGYLLIGVALVVNRFCNIDPTSLHFRRSGIDALLPEINKRYANNPPDVIWCEHTYLYPVAERLRQVYPDAKIFVNAHNVETTLAISIADTMKSRLAKKWMWLESQIMYRVERRMLQSADLVYCCSAQDVERFRKMALDTTACLAVIPNGVDTQHFRQLSVEPGEPVLLFAGTAGYQPNDDAVKWLLTEIMPLIRHKVPEVKLILAGRNANVYWLKYTRKEDLNVQIVADVPDMREWLVRAAVCVVPVRSGSGTRLKILEAMSSTRAIVSTTLGAEGSLAEHERHLLLADDAESFAEAVLLLLRDKERRLEIAAAGRTLVERSYDWQELIKQAMHEFESKLAKPSLNPEQLRETA